MIGLKASVILSGLILYSGTGWHQKIRNKDEFAKGLAKNYCSAGATISANAQYKMDEFARTNDMAGVINDFGTYIHENYHAYNWKINKSRGRRNYFIQDGFIISVPERQVFNSVKLNRIVPNDLEKKIFRYKDYIGSAKDVHMLDSKVNGIYGLLEEFAAYYHGSKAVLELYPYLQGNFGYKQFEPWHEFLTIQTSSHYALYEFQLFISWYLQYAKAYEPEVYRYILNNQQLKLAYSVIVSRFKKEVEKYFLIREVVLAKFGKRFRLDDEYLHIDSDGDGWHESGLGIPDDDIKFLSNLLEQPEHNILSEIRLSESEIKRMTRLLANNK